jgi:DnaJ-class molecular chaperone
MSENYYNILGVNESSTKDEIKRAYRTLQMKFHPDKNHGSQEAINMTQKINEAYETLGDDEKKDEYDMRRNNPFFKMNSHGSRMDEVPLNDIFNMMLAIEEQKDVDVFLAANDQFKVDAQAKI